jgi:nitrogen regulatory protein P-II 1
VNKIEAIIRPEKLPPVREALAAAGFRGMTVIRSEGRGDNLGVTKRGGRGTTSYVDFTLTKVKLEIVVRDEDTGKVIDIIVGTAATGKPGDGRIFVSPVVATIRIDTGERDAASL